MSAGYASRLSAYPNKGVCGLPESRDTKRAYTVKIDALVAAIKESSRIVIFTGAGISTAAGIPDFRGPNGVWTQEEEQKKKNQRKMKNGKRKRPEDGEDHNKQKPAAAAATATAGTNMDFAAVKPTYTHRAITRLIHARIFRFCITQNVDGLFQRSGLSRNQLAVLHGCAFTEKCEDCGTEHFRDTDCGGMSFQKTGRKCEICHGDLRDTLLDWEDPLPEDDMARSEEECEQADLVICLGTSLRIFPANQLPLKAKKFVVVNLQQTLMDEEAFLLVRESVDTVLKDVMNKLGYELPDENESPKIERFWKPKTETDSDKSKL